jgi:hypothetical protein
VIFPCAFSDGFLSIRLAVGVGVQLRVNSGVRVMVRRMLKQRGCAFVAALAAVGDRPAL